MYRPSNPRQSLIFIVPRLCYSYGRVIRVCCIIEIVPDFPEGSLRNTIDLLIFTQFLHIFYITLSSNIACIFYTSHITFLVHRERPVSNTGRMWIYVGGY